MSGNQERVGFEKDEFNIWFLAQVALISRDLVKFMSTMRDRDAIEKPYKSYRLPTIHRVGSFVHVAETPVREVAKYAEPLKGF